MGLVIDSDGKPGMHTSEDFTCSITAAQYWPPVWANMSWLKAITILLLASAASPLLTLTQVTYDRQLFYHYSIHVEVAEIEDGEQYPMDMSMLHVTTPDVVEVGLPQVMEYFPLLEL
ncbi:hypothetical protein BKA82DRAFT_11479 [Pisolithus tinctorius]|uniref:Uncharacterized protein n=1 Tax=Pisolithus tinctorius Marx 270 TaxID=870435 RepID=A0A0C3P8E5_PISTI|nr:hypothetical protein BKA82DRAFT_11479 [Pisolithus tinctorius]KIN93159.1 hypothetical protein M404DRAFT_11479 [Pisolithus tinctorius Marx 270]KIO03749.1 hypothetical protein M404DRAFT_9411 [Pisolithus tinctorius Marx 270]